MHDNFVRIHQTIRCSPAMAAGVTPKLWELGDMVKVLEKWEATRRVPKHCLATVTPSYPLGLRRLVIADWLGDQSCQAILADQMALWHRLRGALYALKADVVAEVGGYDKVTLRMLPRLTRPGDGDYGI
jgi:hypothetical protein